MTPDLETAVRIAADSPDQKVRQIAMRRMSIDAEIASLESFLQMYVTLAVPETASAKKVVAPATAGKPIVVVKHTSDRPETAGSRLMTACESIITGSGKPMKMSFLFDEVTRLHPDIAPASPNSLRAQATNTGRIKRVDVRGYWPVNGDAPPEPDNDE